MKDKNKELFLLTTLLSTSEFQTDIILDEQVNDCLFYLYLYLLIEPDDKNKDEYFIKFNNLYEALSSKQQELVKKDYLNILKQRQEQEEINTKKLTNKKKPL